MKIVYEIHVRENLTQTVTYTYKLQLIGKNLDKDSLQISYSLS